MVSCLPNAVLEIREKSQRQKIAVTMLEFDSKSDRNFLDVFPTNFSLEYMKSINQYSYDIHFNLIISLTFFQFFHYEM